MSEPLTVLVVDDEPTVLKTLGVMLTSNGHRSLTAASGQEALQICEAHDNKIDLLLTDINMPAMNGIELAQCLAQTHPAMPVLFMTDSSLETPQMRILLREGNFRATEVLRKPFSSKVLMKAIKYVVQTKNRRHL